MTDAPARPATPAPELLHFACGGCGTHLTVPMALSGVEGPCPACGVRLRAPATARVRETPPAAPPPARAVTPTEPAPAPRRTVLPEPTRRVPAPRTEAPAPAPVPPRGDRPRRKRVVFRSKEKKPAPRPAPSSDPEPERAERLPRPAEADDAPLSRNLLLLTAAVAGGLLAFGGTWWTLLRREPWPPPATEPLTTRPPPPPEAPDPLDVLAAQRAESQRELHAMMAAQRAALRFVTAPSAAEAALLLDEPAADPAALEAALSAVRRFSPWRLSFVRRQRLPDQLGYVSTWVLKDDAVAPEFALEVDDRTGLPRVRWKSLAAAATAPPEPAGTQPPLP